MFRCRLKKTVAILLLASKVFADILYADYAFNVLNYTHDQNKKGLIINAKFNSVNEHCPITSESANVRIYKDDALVLTIPLRLMDNSDNQIKCTEKPLFAAYADYCLPEIIIPFGEEISFDVEAKLSNGDTSVSSKIALGFIGIEANISSIFSTYDSTTKSFFANSMCK